MPRFELQHPHDPTVQVVYGLDYAIGFFAAVDFGQCHSPEAMHRALIEYDAFQPGFNRDHPLRGCLEFLSEHGLFTLENLNEAIHWFDVHGDKSAPKRLRLAVTVISNMKRSAD